MKLSDALNVAKAKIVQQREEVLRFIQDDFYQRYEYESTNLKYLPEYIRAGNLIAENFSYPALFPLKRIRGMVFEINDHNRNAVNLTMESIGYQIIKQIAPEYRHLAILDTRTLGNSFSHIKEFCRVIYLEEEVRKNLREQLDKSAGINLGRYGNIDEYNSATGNYVQYRFIFISDFPHGFSRDALEYLNTLIFNNKVGVFVFMTYDKSIYTNDFDRNKVNEILRQLVYFTKINDGIYRVANIGNHEFYNERFHLDLEVVDEDKLYGDIFALMDTKQESLSFDIKNGIRIPIGTLHGENFFLTLGHESTNYHCIIGGQSGKGKSKLIENIIARGIESYTAQELNFILLDCKGIDAFRQFTECKYILHSRSSNNVGECIKFIEYMDSIFREREELFKEAGVKELSEYIEKTGRSLPRILCIIDEFHILFTGGYKETGYVESILILKIARIGRASGIHLLVSTQSLGDGVNRSMLDNIPLRIALGMTDNQSEKFLGSSNTAAMNLEPQMAVYNNANGDKRANQIIRINNIDDNIINNIIRKRS